MQKQKRVAAIHDLSCAGRSSLAVALPILSAAGCETIALPTALLSTHTGDFTGYTYLDLTSEMEPIYKHWKELNLEFDAIYSGFLGSYEQIDIINNFYDAFKKDNTLIMVDPVMGDNGVLYSTYTNDMVKGVKRLCQCADIILPNLTEAAYLLGEEYKKDKIDRVYIENTLYKLADLGAKKIILTGVSLETGKSGSASFDSESNEISFASCPKVQGFFHGTGDVYASILLGSMMNGLSLKEATSLATEITYKAILHTDRLNVERRYGVCFELIIPDFVKGLFV